jgi:arsenite methyltransferase
VRAAEIVVEQLSCPRGRLAGITAAVLNASNRSFNRDAVDILGPKPKDHVVDIGFGGGAGLKELLRHPNLKLVGVELSAEMVGRAQRRLRRDVGAGRLELRQGSVDKLPANDNEFDGAISVNTIYFWTDSHTGLKEVLRVLRPGGLAVIGMERDGQRMFSGVEVDGRRLNPPTAEEVEALMAEVGFEGLTLLGRPGGRVLIRGSRPPQVVT